MISTEFHRYLMENEEFAEDISPNALIIFQVEGEDEFNNWHKDTSLKNCEEGQPVIYVYVKKWRKHSSIEEIKVANAIA
jgi:ABC-type Fe3+-citrate transport system substrate-binding protein